jgi:penicillin-binding protein 2
VPVNPDIKRRSVFTRRALMVAGAQVGALGLLSAKLYQIQIVEGSRYSLMAKSNRVSARLLAPPRGRILDRFGVDVAGNQPNWRALLVAEQTDNVAATLDRFSSLVPLTDRDRVRIERDLHRNRRFIPVLVRDFLTWDDMAKIEVNAPDLPGILVDIGNVRLYPYGPTLAHVVGYVAPPTEADVGDDPMLALPGIRIGRAAVEKYHDKLLRGRAGVVQLEVNAVGRVIRELDRDDGTPGAEVGLTIDADLQKQVMARLGDEAASAVVMDCRNGEVLAMATNPSFDPTLFNSGISQAQWIEWTRNSRTPLINKAVAGLYAPGSTFKMCVALAALEARTLTPYDHLYCRGYLDVGNARFHCWKKTGHGSLDLHGGIKHSCDVYFYQVALKTGADRIAEMAKRLGMGVKLDVELPEQKKGLVPTKEWREAEGYHWNLGDTVVYGIGQGFLQLTPLQLATYVSRIATGRVVQPHLTRTINGVTQPGQDPNDWPALDLPPKFLQAVRGGMFGVVNEAGGTAPGARLSIPGVQLAGKTGSTQVHRVSRELREHGHFDSSKLPWKLRPHALFVCFAPYDNPRYAASVVVEHGNAGAAAAAPIAKDIMTDVLTRDPVNRKPPAGERVAKE